MGMGRSREGRVKGPLPDGLLTLCGPGGFPAGWLVSPSSTGLSPPSPPKIDRAEETFQGSPSLGVQWSLRPGGVGGAGVRVGQRWGVIPRAAQSGHCHIRGRGLVPGGRPRAADGLWVRPAPLPAPCPEVTFAAGKREASVSPSCSGPCRESGSLKGIQGEGEVKVGRGAGLGVQGGQLALLMCPPSRETSKGSAAP